MGLEENPIECQYKTILGVKLPVLRDMESLLASTYYDLINEVAAEKIGINVFYLKMFCAWSQHEQSSAKVPFNYLSKKVLSAKQRQELVEGMTYLINELDESKERLEQKRKEMQEIFDPREGSDLKNDSEKQATTEES